MKTLTLSLLAVSVLLTGCNLPTSAPAPTDVVLPPIATATALPPTPAAAVTFEPALYQDELGRYELSYPAGWTVSSDAGGSRGSYVQFTSWAHEGGIDEIPVDGSLVQVAVYLWDPQHDLPARLEMRKTALIASGNIILSEKGLTLASGQEAARLVIQDTAGGQSVLIIAELGEDYVELSGIGDLALIDVILATFRITV
jgi:hypothetical protein